VAALAGADGAEYAALATPTTALSGMADYASGPARRFGGVSDDELFGLLGARNRLSSRQAWELLMAIAELIRRRPAPGCVPRGPARMPSVWAEGTAGELSVQLAITTRTAADQLGLAWDLTVKLPLTAQKLRDGVVDKVKTQIIAGACAVLTPEEAARAEAILFALPEVDRMTNSMIRDRIARAAIEVNPDAARKRREEAARDRRVEVYPEASGNMVICGRELPAIAVLRIDRALTARARMFKKAGVEGGMDELRVLAFLERWGEADPLGDLARTRAATAAPEESAGGPASADRTGAGHGDANERGGGTGREDDESGEDQTGDGNGTGGPGDGGSPRPGPGPAGPGGGACTCGGLPAVIHLTASAATLTGLAERPGTLRGAGPLDPEPEANTPNRYRAGGMRLVVLASLLARPSRSEHRTTLAGSARSRMPIKIVALVGVRLESLSASSLARGGPRGGADPLAEPTRRAVGTAQKHTMTTWRATMSPMNYILW